MILYIAILMTSLSYGGRAVSAQAIDLGDNYTVEDCRELGKSMTDEIDKTFGVTTAYFRCIEK